MKAIQDFSTPAASLNAPGTVIVDPRANLYDSVAWIKILAELQGITGGTLDVTIQDSADGVKWLDYVHFPQIAAAAAAIKYSYEPAFPNAITVIGTATDPATPTVVLAAGASRGGHPLSYLRAVYVAGAGASAGVAQTVTVFAR